MKTPKLIASLSFALLLAATALTANAQVAPTIQSFSIAVGGFGDAVVNKPAGTAPADLLVACIALEKGSDAEITGPSGWTLIRRTDNSTDSGLATYFKIAGAAEPT